MTGNEPLGFDPNLQNKPDRNKLFPRDDAGRFWKIIEGTSPLDFLNPHRPANLTNKETST